MSGAADGAGGGSLHLLEGDQARGVVPDDNVWLTASAGTGKTQVLTGRVLRLLLQGVKPGSILGLTFTKAGAAEMAQRVRRILAEWVQLDEAKLKTQIFKIGADRNDPDVATRARTLFAAVIDAPGQGLAFQTIHSFCQSLLGAFPLEAGLVPGFRAIEEAEGKLLARELLANLATAAERGDDLPFLRNLSAVAERLGEAKAVEWLERCAARSADMLRLPDPIGPYLRGRLILPEGDPDDWLAQWCAGEADEAGWQAVATGFARWGTPGSLKDADAVAKWLSQGAVDRAKALPELASLVITKEGTLNKKKEKAFVEIEDVALKVATEARAAIHTATAMAASDRYAQALAAGRTFAGKWASYKQNAGLVEFDDLIARALKLLGEEGSALWIRYKLDQRIDHILVDEAQDTNADQWTIIKALAEEYFAGEGQRDPATRTLFVVGDYKQAIFGFQGTDPANFTDAEAWFREKGLAAERPFADLSIATSYRCAPAILDAVDAVAANIGAAQLGLPADMAIRHDAAPGKSGGSVTLWPVECANDAEPDADDQAAIEGEESWIDDATRRVADRIARTVRGWIDKGYQGSEVHAGDVLVLVRSRKELAGLIVARLQARGVPVAGIDRLSLDKSLAVQDLLAAARFAVQPLDDLNLASLLVSPLGDFSQDDLWRFGAGRGKVPLWQHLRGQAKVDPDFAERLLPMRAILKMADYVSPYAFFETILSGSLRGRAKLLARLGNAARDPIEELLSQAMAFGRDEGPSLHRFLRWFDSRDNKIKRENDAAGDAARVMTVHGAKGLEARFVILADAAGNPDAGATSKGFDWPVAEGWTLPVTGFAKGEHPAVLAAAQEGYLARERREHWRLLYVAMTRAEEALFVTGSLGKKEAKKGPSADSWYARIATAMDGLGPLDAIDPVWGRSVLHERRRDGRRARPKPETKQSLPLVMPEWVNRLPPAEPRPSRPLSPSALGEAEALAVPLPPTADSFAARRGTLMHALFERLPGVAAARRQAAALAWLAGQASELDLAQRTEMVDAVLRVLDDPAQAMLFSPAALAEAPLSALVDGRVIAGTVDRLLVTDDAVQVIDFKTGGHVPDSADAVPLAYVKQMAAYRAALRVIFPNQRVDAALLYTGGPHVITLPAALLDAHRPGE